MEREVLTHDIFSSCKGAVQRSEHCFEFIVGHGKGQFYFNYYTVDKLWGVTYLGYTGIPPYKEVGLPCLFRYVDELATFWVLMTGTELEPLY